MGMVDVMSGDWRFFFDRANPRVVVPCYCATMFT